MSLARYRLQPQPQQKVRPEHLDRAAAVYVRQSTRQQVLDHSESTRLQYALAERAVALGCARSQVVVIDDDLGVSAATADSRKGFARLVTEVTMGRAGVVLGASRCHGWRGPAGTGICCWSCAACPACCSPTRTASMTLWARLLDLAWTDFPAGIIAE
ncbi:MAG: recombinase family protein [Streptosporangiaceae bacterium]